MILRFCRTFHILSLLLILLLVAGCRLPAGDKAPDGQLGGGATATLTIVHSNDMHGSLEPDRVSSGGRSYLAGGIAYIVGQIKAARAKNAQGTLVLDAGDIWQGTFVSNQTQGAVMIEAMNLAGYDAAAVGNHDFDFGQEVLRARLAQAAFPFLAANIVEQVGGQRPSWVQPYIIKTVNGVRVGIIGLANPGTAYIVKPANVLGLRFLPGSDAVGKYLPQVRIEADIVIVLSHQGVEDDHKLARALPGIDIIVGGHSHTLLRAPEVEGQTIIVQAGSNGKYLGQLSITYDRAARKITGFTRQNEVLDVQSTAMQPDPAVAQLVQAKLDAARAVMNRPLGETTINLENCMSGECPLGNLVADALRAANQAGERPADIAMHNNSGLRARLPRGPITYGALYEVLPFDNTLAAADLTGAQIKQILEKTVASRPGNLVVSGLTYSFDQTRRVGARITGVTVGGQPLDLTRVYRVQTIDYLMTGGDDQTTFKDGKNIVYGDAVVDVVADYIRKHSPITERTVQPTPRISGRQF